MKPYRLLVTLLLALSVPDTGRTCSTFVLKTGDRQVYGRNYDWYLDDALIVVNKRGCRKRGLARPDEIGKTAA